MNSTTKTTWIVIAVIVVIWAIYLLVGRNNSNVLTSGDNNASTSVQADRSTGLPNNTNNSSNTVANQNNTIPVAISDSALAMMVGNSLVRVPQTGVDVALTAGNADYINGTTKGHISIGKILGRVSTDNGTDVVAEMTLTKSLSPNVLKYVAMFHNVGQTVTFTSAVLIGDRVQIGSITVSADKSAKVDQKPTNFMTSSIGYNLAVSYLDRKNGEPFSADPTVQESKIIRVKNHILATN